MEKENKNCFEERLDRFYGESGWRKERTGGKDWEYEYLDRKVKIWRPIPEEQVVEKILTEGPDGNGCCSYRIQLHRPYTVQEFVDMVLKVNAEKWGTIVTDSDKRGIQLIYCTYENGKIKTDFMDPETKEQLISEVEAYGGRARMDYSVKILK